MSEWHEMYVWPYAPHDREVIGRTSDQREVPCSFHPGKQRWVDRSDQVVTITHWRELEADEAQPAASGPGGRTS